HRLAIADRATSNRYGPYGLAYGRSGGMGCGYAWQQVDGQERAAGILPGRRYRLDIRLQFCGANLAENDVVTMMDGVQLSSLTRAELARAEAFSPPQTAIVRAEAPAYAPTAAPKPSVRAAAKPARLAVKAPEVAPAVTRTADFPMPPA
ncbi:MAG: cellulose biosynthesis protein BcsN, partial [Pseudomonadota bacterium]